MHVFLMQDAGKVALEEVITLLITLLHLKK